MMRQTKMLLAKWSIRVVIVMLIFIASVLIARWMVSVKNESTYNAEQITENTKGVAENHNDIEELQQGALVSPTPTPEKSRAIKRNTPRHRPTPRPWWSRLFNP